MTSNPTFDNSAKIHMNTTRDILFADPMVLAKWITQQYYDEIPCNINNCEDLAIAGAKLGTLTNSYSYLTAVLMYAKVMVKELKHRAGRKPKSSETAKMEEYEQNFALYEEMVTRRDILVDAVDMVKQQYNAISRMLTAKQEINKELFMSDSYTID